MVIGCIGQLEFIAFAAGLLFFGFKGWQIQSTDIVGFWVHFIENDLIHESYISMSILKNL